jgi:electron transfer flavoprotein beta subunit
VGYDIVVCVKQVPDTANLTGRAMKDDGTVNRSALPAIFNPEDLNALELALRIREDHGGTVTALTMGLPKAGDVLRDCLFRGADRAILVTDRRAAASDTLATSYVLSCAVRKIGTADIVMCGRQAIDGDTAQIGPQLAEKLGIPQVTYVDEILGLADGRITARRGLEHGYEVVRAPMPVLMTVTDSAPEARPPSAKRLLVHRKSKAPAELGREADPQDVEKLRDSGHLIEQWDIDDIECDEEGCGAKGSPTRVKNVDSVQLVSEEHKQVEPTPDGLTGLIEELIEEHFFD